MATGSTPGSFLSVMDVCVLRSSTDLSPTIFTLLGDEVALRGRTQINIVQLGIDEEGIVSIMSTNPYLGTYLCYFLI